MRIWAALLLMAAVSTSSASFVNGSFEIGTLSSWSTSGDTAAQNGVYAGQNPYDGTFHARIGCGSGTVSVPVLESFLGLPGGSLNGLGGSVFNSGGSAMYQVVDLEPGDRVVFFWNFVPQAGTPTGDSSQNDAAFYVFHLNTQSVNSVVTLASVQSSGGVATGYRGQTSVVITAQGSYRFGVGSIDKNSVSGGGVYNADTLLDGVRVLLASNVDVIGNGLIVTNGDGSPSSGDHTDFGSVPIVGATSTSRTFTIANNGEVPIGVGNVSASGPHFLNFNVTAQPVSPVAPGTSTTFTVNFNPSAKGVRSATLTFTNTVPSRDPYSFSIQGFGEGYIVDVTTPYGAPVPPVGGAIVSGGIVLTNFVTATEEHGTTQFVASGWSMPGNNPTSGTTNRFSTIFTNDTTLTWLWTTNVFLDTEAGPHGTVNVPDGFYPINTVVPVTAVADQYYHFDIWSDEPPAGDETDNPLSLLMEDEKVLTANFAENLTANTGTPEWWLAQFGFTNNFEAAALADPDGDHVPMWGEYVAGTDPTLATSFFHAVTGPALGTNFSDIVYTNEAPPFNVLTQRVYETLGIVLQWDGVTGRIYDVESSVKVVTPSWSGKPGLTNLPAQLPRNVVTNYMAILTNRLEVFRIRAKLP